MFTLRILRETSIVIAGCPILAFFARVGTTGFASHRILTCPPFELRMGQRPTDGDESACF